jgi:hypothetical protein
MTNIKSRLIGIVPILIYKPNSKYVGVDNDMQQIDIYPTILDMIDMTNLLEAGVVVCLTRIAVPLCNQFNRNNLSICEGQLHLYFDGKKCTWFYDKDDKALLIKTRNKEMDEIELNCKAFIEDYMNRVIDKVDNKVILFLLFRLFIPHFSLFLRYMVANSV